MIQGKVSSRTLMKGALVLTIAAFVSKILSAVYRIPFQNIVGDVGFYIYQQVYPFYGIFLALSTYGFPVVISRLLADRYDDNEEEASLVLQAAFILLSVVGICLFVSIYSGAKWMAVLMGDSELEPLLKVISFSFLFLPFISILRGYFQGKGDMLPTAVSQIVEQSVRVTTILICSFILINEGYSLYLAGSGALFGSLTGGGATILVLVSFLLVRSQNKFSLKFKGRWKKSLELMKILGLHGFAICFSGMLIVLLQFIDAFSVYTYLVQSGIAENEAKALKGVYDRGQPLIQLGTVVATSLSLIAVPLITAAHKKKDDRAVKENILLALKVSFIVGLGASFGLVNLVKPVNVMLFENSKDSSVIAVFCIAILLCSLVLTLSSVLHGMGKLYLPAFIILMGIIIKFLLNAWLVPLFATMGASLSTVIVLGLMTIGLIIVLRYVFPIPFLSKKFYLAASLALLGMTVILQAWLQIEEILLLIVTERVASTVLSLGGVVIGGVVYIFIVLNGNMLKDKEIELFPFGSKLMRLKRR
ncbi:polysaccharide biosynthesis protein [Bacillus spongiae]|uniref:Polysaccharide biosynthesis protein n=1 Tax=Bacillus spongiae TaxID=2683610 RepID=A0ABU8HJR4_9BACI